MTAVEWLVKIYLQTNKIDSFDIEQAKEMEKQQKIQFGYRCIGEVDSELGDLVYKKVPEEIYNETYNI